MVSGPKDVVSSTSSNAATRLDVLLAGYDQPTQ